MKRSVTETLSPDEKKQVNQMYNKDGTMTDIGNKVMRQGQIQDILKKAMKELKRIDAEVMFRTRDMQKAVATIEQGNIAGALQDLVNGVDGPENQIQDTFNDAHDTLQRLINPKTDKELDDEYWADVDDMRARNRVGEEKTLHGVMSKVFDNALSEFEFNPRAGHRDQPTHPGNRGLGAEPDDMYITSRPKSRPKKLAPTSSPRPRARPANLQMRNDINKAVRQAVASEGKSPHKKGTAKYKAHMNEGARGLGSIDWPEEEMMQTATDAIRHGYSSNDSFSHLYSMYGDDHRKWLLANEDDILDVFSQYMDESISEGESPHKKGTAKYKAHMAAMHAEGYKVMPPMDPKYTERSGLEGPFTTLSGKVVYYDPKEGSYYDPDTDMYMSYDEFQNYDKDYSGMKDERDEVKENPTHSRGDGRAEVRRRQQDAKADDFLNRVAAHKADTDRFLNTTVNPVLDHPVARGIRKRQNRVKEIALNQMRESLKVDRSLSDNEVVAKYTRTTLDESYDTWDKINEQVQFIISMLAEGHSADSKQVIKLLQRTNVQEQADSFLNRKYKK